MLINVLQVFRDVGVRETSRLVFCMQYSDKDVLAGHSKIEGDLVL
jgi:hypothetical protein